MGEMEKHRSKDKDLPMAEGGGTWDMPAFIQTTKVHESLNAKMFGMIKMPV